MDNNKYMENMEEVFYKRSSKLGSKTEEWLLDFCIRFYQSKMWSQGLLNPIEYEIMEYTKTVKKGHFDAFNVILKGQHDITYDIKLTGLCITLSESKHHTKEVIIQMGLDIFGPIIFGA